VERWHGLSTSTALRVPLERRAAPRPRAHRRRPESRPGPHGSSRGSNPSAAGTARSHARHTLRASSGPSSGTPALRAGWRTSYLPSRCRYRRTWSVIRGRGAASAQLLATRAASRAAWVRRLAELFRKSVWGWRTSASCPRVDYHIASKPSTPEGSSLQKAQQRVQLHH
jgi:hypothetical protein